MWCNLAKKHTHTDAQKGNVPDSRFMLSASLDIWRANPFSSFLRGSSSTMASPEPWRVTMMDALTLPPSILNQHSRLFHNIYIKYLFLTNYGAFLGIFIVLWTSVIATNTSLGMTGVLEYTSSEFTILLIEFHLEVCSAVAFHTFGCSIIYLPSSLWCQGPIAHPTSRIHYPPLLLGRHLTSVLCQYKCSTSKGLSSPQLLCMFNSGQQTLGCYFYATFSRSELLF